VLTRVRCTGYGIGLAALLQRGAGPGRLRGKKMEKAKGGSAARELAEPAEF
jgi:hypothetical protein